MKESAKGKNVSRIVDSGNPDYLSGSGGEAMVAPSRQLRSTTILRVGYPKRVGAKRQVDWVSTLAK